MVLNALDAAERGAQVHVRTRLESARVEGGRWIAECIDASASHSRCAPARIVNATGAWVNDLLSRCGVAPRATVRLVKGSHLIFRAFIRGSTRTCCRIRPARGVPDPFPGRLHAGRHHRRTLRGDAAAPRISVAEADYLCDCVNRFLRRPVSPADAVASYSGVRPLYDDGSASQAQQVSRDYRLELQGDAGAPVLSVYGGKITTYRRLAEHALDLLLPALGQDRDESWTAGAPLPGGDIADGDLVRFTRDAQQRWHGLDPRLVARLAHGYGTRLASIVAGARSDDDLGRDYGLGLRERELDYLVRHEWARTPEDVLVRRTRLGLEGSQRRGGARAGRLLLDESALDHVVAGLADARGHFEAARVEPAAAVPRASPGCRTA